MARVDVVQVLAEAMAGGRCAPIVLGEGAGRVVVKQAPGRLDVLGSLGAAAGGGGTVAQMALGARAAVAVQEVKERELRGWTNALDEGETRVVLGEREAMIAGGAWGGLLLGAWRALGEAGVELEGGLAVRVESGIAAGAGQGSSTAVLVALVCGVLELQGVAMEAEAVAGVVARAEALSGGAGRVVDAMTCLLAEAGHLLRYSAQPHRLVGAVPVPPDLRILALETGVVAEEAEAERRGEVLEELRIAGAMGVRIIDQIYTDLGQVHTPLHGYLANTSPLLYRQYFRMLLPKRLRGSDFVRTYGALPDGMAAEEGKFYRVRTVVDHLMAEHEHAEQFVQAMEELEDMRGGAVWGDAEGEVERQRTLQRAGRLALASHHSYRLRLELSCAEADWLVDHLMEAGPERGVFGARITGCGGGGTVMALVHRGQQGTDAVLEVMTRYQKEMGRVLRIQEAGAGGSVQSER